MMRLPLSMARATDSLVFVSGQLALRDGRIIAKDVAAQTHFAIDAIERELAAFGLTLRDVVKTSIWLASAGDYAAFNTAYSARFADPYPARSAVISELAFPGARVEIEAIAARRMPA